jgi:hypothetical protein
MLAIEHSGMWWLPTNPQNKVAGTLTFSNEDGIALELIGALEDFGNFNRREPCPLILGLSGDGKRITLSNCVFAGVSVGMPGFARESYKASFFLTGVHFSEPDEVRFSRLSVRFSHLADWVRTSGFAVKKYWNEHKIEVTYSLPADRETEISKGRISLSFICNTSGDGIEEMNLRQSVWLELKAHNEYGFNDLTYQCVRPLQDLLSLATTKPNSILELNVFSKQAFFEKEDGETVEIPIQLCFQQKYFEPRLGNLLIPDYMLFTLGDIADDFQSVMERWFAISEDLDTVCNLFFGVQYTPTLNLENRFLNVVQAVESYHRRRMKNEVLPKAEHKRLKSAVLNKVDAEHKIWLEGLLAYSNEPRLEHRIRELTEKAAEVINPLVTNKEEFAKKVKDTRNYLTHYDKRLKEKAARGEELFWLTQKLSYLLQACFLIELGLPLEKCAQLLHRNQAFIFAVGQLSENKSP